ncbi:MAG: hypothetical protein NT013_31115 [Planctomycetia bacterium]|nr:hypothetical protein [Planctomycetia bacterium]
MPRFVVVGISTLLLLASTSTSSLSLAQETVPGWHNNLAQAQRLSEESGKPLFIVFRCVR